MLASQETQDRILFAVAISAAALIHVSIAGSQVLLGLGVLLLLIFRGKLQFPRIWIPLSAFFLWTALADVLSPDPWGGRAQIRKFFVFLFIPLVYGVFVRQFSKVFYLMVAWTAAASASGLWSLEQYLVHFRNATYQSYVGQRTTGFESHWMTFGALQLSVLSLLLAQYFFSNRKMPLWAYSSVAVLSAAILISGTRSIWGATIPAALYLIWFWRPKMMFALPVVLAVAFFLAPPTTRQRILSMVHPDPKVDSNEHREVTFRTGIEMIKAHPWLGLGPEEIGRNFNAYVPADIPRPLPIGYYGHLHSIYLQYAAERGIPGLLLLLWFIGTIVWDCARGIVRLRGVPSQELFLLHGTIAVTIGILVGGIFEYNLGDSEVLMMFVSVVALAYAALHQMNYVNQAAGLSPSADTVSK
jgi:putative inorganic carbon (HCO3(-)) transporter